MFKKLLCLALALMMIMSVAVIAASADQVEIAAQGADNDDAGTGADSDIASTGLDAGSCLNFDASSSGWSDVNPIGFYIWEVGGEEFYPFGSNKIFKSEETSSGIWSFDPAANDITLKEGTQYCIIFRNKSGMQTYNLMFDTTCLGDTAVVDTSVEYENPADSNKHAYKTTWKNSNLGPQLCISSIGTVQGTTCPANTTPYQMFVDFLKNTLTNARTYANKDDQTLLDDTAKGLGIGSADVEKAIAEAGVTVEWSKDKSSLNAESDASANQSGAGSSGSSSGNASSSSSSSSGSSSSSSSTKSGSASNTQTGQEETVLFIMLGVMVAAAGVIFFTRKRERA